MLLMKIKLGNTFMLFLGSISYEIYLLHLKVIEGFFSLDFSKGTFGIFDFFACYS